MRELLENAATELVADPPRAAPSIDDLWRRVARRRRRRAAALMLPAAAVLVVGLVVIQTVRAPADRDPLVDVGTTVVSAPTSVPAAAPSDTSEAGRLDGQIAVEIEQVQYWQTFDAECADPFNDGSWDTTVIVAAADRAGGRWRNSFVYPDRTWRSLIAIDSPWYPTSVTERGDVQVHTAGCSVNGEDVVMVAEPGQGSFYSLNAMADIPTNGPDGEPLEAWVTAVPGFRDLAVQQSGAQTDSLGRTAELWRQQIDGFFSAGDLDNVPLTQIQQWYVEPGTDRVLERRYEQHVEGIGTARWVATLVGHGGVLLPEAAFRSVDVATEIESPRGPERRPPLLTGDSSDLPIDSAPDPTSEAFATVVANILARTTPDASLIEHATRSDGTDTLTWTNFGYPGSRLHVARSTPAIIAGNGLEPTTAVTPAGQSVGVVYWPDQGSNRTIGIIHGNELIVVDSEAPEIAGSAIPTPELVVIALEVTDAIADR